MLRPKPGKYVQFLSTPSTRRTTAIELRLSTNVTKFLSTPSARRATSGWRPRPPWRCNFYPRPPRGGRHGEKDQGRQREPISIHALREEGDCSAHRSACQQRNFYPRPPRGGRRPEPLPTRKSGYFYPRPPRGGRPRTAPTTIWMRPIFLSTPSARRATKLPLLWIVRDTNFYPRPPRGGRPFYGTGSRTPHGISIHALREEGDLFA